MQNFIYYNITPQFLEMENNRFCKEYIPDYFFKSIYQTKKLNLDSRIIFVTNLDIPKNIITELNLTYIKIDNDIIDNIKLLKYVLQYYDKRPFRSLTLIRYALCEYICDILKLESFCFIEGDNLIYYNIDNIMDKYCNNTISVCNMTCKGYYSSGIFFCNNIPLLKELNDFTCNHIYDQKDQSTTDMNILCKFHTKTHKLSILPMLPTDTKDNMLFDAASIGQFLFGENRKRKNSFIDKGHRFYKEFYSKYNKKFKIYLNNNIYRLEFRNKIYDLFNLHIHNKANFDKAFIFLDEYRNKVNYFTCV